MNQQEQLGLIQSILRGGNPWDELLASRDGFKPIPDRRWAENISSALDNPVGDVLGGGVKNLADKWSWDQQGDYGDLAMAGLDLPVQAGLQKATMPAVGGLTWLFKNMGREGGESVMKHIGKQAGKLGSKDLPMDEASRMARAKEMGFDTDTVWYHGTDEVFDEFDPNKIGSNFNLDKEGFFFASSKDTANRSRKSYPDKPKYRFTEDDKKAAESGQLLETYLQLQNPLRPSDISGFKHEMGISPTNLYDWNREIVEDALRANPDKDGFIIKANGDRMALVRKPNQIRSTKAKFDPSKKDSANLLASGLLGAFTLDQLNSEQR